MNISQKGGRKVQPPRIDLTPMVDLGFLLITFFMFTTTLAQQKTMELNMPSNEKTDRPMAVPAESTITIIPVKGHVVKYYEGFFEPGKLMQCPTSKVIDRILQKKKEVAALPAGYSKDAHRLHVLIKPDDASSYEDVVHVVDAMLIADVKDYAIMDLGVVEKEVIWGME